MSYSLDKLGSSVNNVLNFEGGPYFSLFYGLELFCRKLFTDSDYTDQLLGSRTSSETEMAISGNSKCEPSPWF